MQPRPIQQKPKYRIKDFSAPGNYAMNKSAYFSNDGTCKLYCLCNQYNLANARKCFRCGESYHNCVANKPIVGDEWQCLHCESKYMDPIYWPEEVLLETFFRTESVVQFGNIVEFGFYLNADQIKKIVEVRGLQDGRAGLAWPMHGEFFLNKDSFPEPVLDIRPLLKNSNRKYRKEEAFILPNNQLKVGKNILTFSIPKLNSAYQAKYQIEIRAVYFLGIYSIKKLSKQELIQKTFKTSIINKTKSLQFLRKQLLGEGQLSIEKSIISLQCPYTKDRIKIPVRGKKCQHYTCICLETLIQTRSGMSSREWQCPICNSAINEPVVDMFIDSILKDGSAGIKVSLDGSGKYQWISFEEDDVSVSSGLSGIKKNSQPKPPPMPEEQKKEKPKSSKIDAPKARMTIQSDKPVQAINLDDDEVEFIPVSQVLQPPKKPTEEQPKIAMPPLQIMIPVEKPKFEKQKQTSSIKQRLKQNLKQRKKKATEPEFIKSIPRKQQYLLTDTRLLDFKPLTFSEYSRKYFCITYARTKVNDDIKAIFKEVM